MTHFAWKPNRDSGSIRSHRNPDTRRRHGCSELPNLKPHNGRAALNTFMKTNKADLASGFFDISFARPVSGWDAGDPLVNGNPLLVRAIDEEVEAEYPETPEWVWDCLYAAALGVQHAEGCVFCD